MHIRAVKSEHVHAALDSSKAADEAWESLLEIRKKLAEQSSDEAP